MIKKQTEDGKQEKKEKRKKVKKSTTTEFQKKNSKFLFPFDLACLCPILLSPNVNARHQFYIHSSKISVKSKRESRKDQKTPNYVCAHTLHQLLPNYLLL